MARKCCICGKTTMYGNKVSKSFNHTHRTWRPNLINVKTIFGDGTVRTIKICTRCYKSDFITKKVRVPKVTQNVPAQQ